MDSNDVETLDFLLSDAYYRDDRLLLSLKDIEKELDKEIQPEVQQSTDHEDTNSTTGGDKTNLTTPRTVDATVSASSTTTSSQLSDNNMNTTTTPTTMDERSGETNEIHFVPALSREDDLMMMLPTTPITPSTISESSPMRDLSSLSAMQTISSPPAPAAASSAKQQQQQPATGSATKASSASKTRAPTPTKKLLAAQNASRASPGPATTSTPPPPTKGSSSSSTKANSSTPPPPPTNSATRKSSKANATVADISKRDSSNGTMPNADGSTLKNTSSHVSDMISKLNSSTSSLKNGGVDENIADNKQKNTSQNEKVVRSSKQVLKKASSTTGSETAGTATNRKLFSRTLSSPAISAPSTNNAQPRSSTTGSQKVPAVARSKSTSSAYKSKSRLAPTIAKPKPSSGPTGSVTSKSLPRVASIRTTAKPKPVAVQDKSGWKPLPPVTRKIVTTSTTTKTATAKTTSKSSAASTTTTATTKPKNPVLAERRANAAATAVKTPYKVSVTNPTRAAPKPSTSTVTKSTTTSVKAKEASTTQPKTTVSPKHKIDTTSVKDAKEEDASGPSSSSALESFTIHSNDWSIASKCQKADNYYNSKLQTAFAKGSVTVMSSFLSKEDETALQNLVTKTKNSKVKLLISETFQRQKTTICILPVATTLSITSSESQQIVNTVADRRSMKAMEAMLHGIPIVTPDWISSCHMNDDSVVLPTSSMYIRSLPSKSLGDEDKKVSVADFGVAFLSAAIDASSGKYKPLGLSSLSFVYTAGFSAVKQGEISELLRDAGAKEIVTKATVATEKIKKLDSSKDSVKLVFLCNDTNVTTITTDLEDQLKVVAKKTKQGTIWIVNANWLYDSITCGEALFTETSWNNENYKPVSGKGLELWNLIRTLQKSNGFSVNKENGSTSESPITTVDGEADGVTNQETTNEPEITEVRDGDASTPINVESLDPTPAAEGETDDVHLVEQRIQI